MKKLLQMKFMLLLCALIVGSGTMWAQTSETISANQFGFTSNTNLSDANATLSATNFTLTFAKNDASNVPAYNSSSEEFRLYKAPSSGKNGGSITIASKSENTTFTKIEFNFSNLPTNYSFSEGSYDKTKNEWSGDATTSLTLTNTDLSGQLKIKSMKIYYETTSSYTITAESNDTDLGTVSLSGTTITASPKVGCRYATPAYTVAPDNSATVVQDGNTFTVTPTANTTVTINFEAIPTHTAKFSVNGTVTEPVSYEEGAAITFPTNIADIEGKSFVGWTTAAIEGTTNTAPDFVISATMGEADVTYYAVFAEQEGESGWFETALSNIATTDIFVFSNGSYAMSNDNGTSSAPAAVAITVSDGKITSVVADNLKWNVSGDANNGYTFYPNGSTNTLYCTTTAGSGSNNNIRVGTGNRKLWIFDGDNYLVTNDNSTDRYLSIYNDQDFRGYINTDLAFVPKFYKYSEGSYSGYCTTVAADTREEAGLSFTESTATVEWYSANQYTGQALTNPHSVSPITWTSSNEGVATVENGTVTVLALGETTIKASFDGDENYKKGEASYTLTVKDSRLEPTVTIHDTFITHTNVFEGTAAGKLTASVKYNDNTIEGATVTWSGDNDAVAKINATTGVVDLVASGTVTFTATYAGNADYSAKTATYEMTVTYSDPNAPGTENNPYTVAEARAAIDAGTGLTNVYATGIVSQTGTLSNGAISYYISDDGTTTDQLQAYKGKGIGGADFTSADDIQVGDVVTIYGNLTKYNSTYEFAQNNQLYFNQPRLTVADEDKTVTVNAEGQIKNHDAQTITINYRNFLETTPSANNVSVLFCDVNGTVAAESYDWIKSITFNENGNGNFTMNCLFEANDGEARTGYVKVTVTVGNTIYYSDIITITQNAPVASHSATFSVNGTATDPVSYEEGAAITFPEVSGVNGMTFMGWTTSEIEGTTDEAPTLVSSATMGSSNITYYAVFAVNSGIGSYTLDYSKEENLSSSTDWGTYGKVLNYEAEDGSVWTIKAYKNAGMQINNGKDCSIKVPGCPGYISTIEITCSAAKAVGFSSNNYEGNGNITYVAEGTDATSQTLNLSNSIINTGYIVPKGGSTSITKIIVNYSIYSDYCTTIPTTGTLTLNAACHDNKGKIYGTFYTNRPYIMPATLRGSVVSVDDGKLVVDEVYDGSNSEVVPANTALLISTADNFTGTHDYTITYATGGDDYSESNMLKGTLTADEETEGDGCLFYRLTMHNGETIGFWWGAAEGGKFKPGANKAYLAVPTSVVSARSGFAFDDEATGISQIENGKLKMENYYDLQGRKVSKPGKGLYIVNGKKVVIK